MSPELSDALEAIAVCLRAIAAEHKKNTSSRSRINKQRSHRRRPRRSPRAPRAATDSSAAAAPMAVDDSLPLSEALNYSLDDLAGLRIVPDS